MLEGGAILQMHQTTSEDQSFLRHIRECGEDLDMDRHLSQCIGGDHQKTAQNQIELLCDIIVIGMAVLRSEML